MRNSSFFCNSLLLIPGCPYVKIDWNGKVKCYPADLIDSTVVVTGL